MKQHTNRMLYLDVSPLHPSLSIYITIANQYILCDSILVINVTTLNNQLQGLYLIKVLKWMRRGPNSTHYIIKKMNQRKHKANRRQRRCSGTKQCDWLCFTLHLFSLKYWCCLREGPPDRREVLLAPLLASRDTRWWNLCITTYSRHLHHSIFSTFYP